MRKHIGVDAYVSTLPGARPLAASRRVSHDGVLMIGIPRSTAPGPGQRVTSVRLHPRGGYLPGHPGEFLVVAAAPGVQLLGQREKPVADAVGAELGGCGDGVVG
jgi:hypothetical protein